MHKLSWQQVHHWRLEQHSLLDRAQHTAFHDVIRTIGGLQAQVMSSAVLALWARVEGFSADDLETALWKKRTLVKTWAMRGTLHIVASKDLALLVAARSMTLPRRPPSWYTYHGVTPDELAAIIEGVRTTLNDNALTRAQLAEAIATSANVPHLIDLLGSGWGALLKPSAYAGELCFGPSQGQNVTFVRPKAWLGEWQEVDGQEALQEVVRRYLLAYGPTTPEAFARWWGTDASVGKKTFRAMERDLVQVDVDGWRAWSLPALLDTPEQKGKAIRLLPAFDPYTIALLREPSVLAADYKAHVSRPQGWISPVVIVDGQMIGVWEHETNRNQTTVKVGLFDKATPAIKQGIEAEAEQLATFLGGTGAVRYE